MAGPRPHSIVGRHEVALVRNGRELFPAMLAAIEGATRTVALEMYWIENDEVGRSFRTALALAARRGVEVRIITDGFGSATLPDSWFEPVAREGGRVAIFRPLLASLEPTAPLGVLARDHRKVLIVDDHHAFVGGMNLCEKWSPIALGGADWRDTAIHVIGPELPRHLGRLFDGSWARIKRTGRPGDARVVWATEGRELGVLANTPEDRRSRKIRQAYLWGLRRARRSIDITCAYFAPRPLFARALVAAVRRGVRVRIILPLASDVWLADVIAASSIRALADAGVMVFGYAGATLHAKTAVVDARWVTVGSHNLDALSWAYNLECNVVVDDETIGREAEQMFEDDLLLSIRLPVHAAPGPTEAISAVFGRALGWFYAIRR